MYPERPIETTKRKELPPLGLKIFKGEREMTMSRLVGAQSFTSLMADLHQIINSVSTFSTHLLRTCIDVKKSIW